MSQSMHGVPALGLAIALSVTAPPALANDDVRTSMRYTLDNLESLAGGDAMPMMFRLRLDRAREVIESATPAELDLPPPAYARLTMLEYGTYNLLRGYEAAAASAGGKTPKTSTGTRLQSAPTGAEAAFEDDFPEIAWEGYPGLEESYEQEGLSLASLLVQCASEGIVPENYANNDEYLNACISYLSEQLEPGGGPGTGTLQFGSCGHEDGAPKFANGLPVGYTPEERNNAMTAALALETTKDIAEQICGQNAFGFNTSALCIISDVAYFVVKAIDDSQELCNDNISGVELEQTLLGVKVIHENIRHIHEDLYDQAAMVGDVDADLASHDADIKALLEQTRANQEAIIELLTTPSGRRPGWVD